MVIYGVDATDITSIKAGYIKKSNIDVKHIRYFDNLAVLFTKSLPTTWHNILSKD